MKVSTKARPDERLEANDTHSQAKIEALKRKT